MKLHQPVLVEWVDSLKTSGWTDVPKDKDMRCATFGMLMESTENCVVVAQNVSAFCHGDYMTIPRSAVKRIRKLRL